MKRQGTPPGGAFEKLSSLGPSVSILCRGFTGSSGSIGSGEKVELVDEWVKMCSVPTHVVKEKHKE